ncbi:MAG TPA: radical SAM protein [Solirubrobacteraceae bacterium]|nr:radical SAM protein [Solirubrobacteraceae bacterium]
MTIGIHEYTLDRLARENYPSFVGWTHVCERRKPQFSVFNYGPRAPFDAVVRALCEHMFVRWSNLTLEGDEQRRLPGYRDPAEVRRFDAPEALDMRFYEVHAKSVLNRVPEQSRMPFRWTINPYRGCSHGCLYCFARPTHKYLDFNPGRDFEREIVVKVNAPEVLRVELARPSWRREHVALGTNTDPYQWVEGRYRLMVGIWEALRDAANPCSVLTKSPLLLRDLDLMLEIARRASFSACLSIPTLDEKAWRATEPHTPSPRARLEAVAELNRVGIPTGVLIAPLMPGINDAPHQIEPLLDAAAQAGATNTAGVALHLRGDVRKVFMDWLREQRPDLVPRYQELYRRRAYAPPQERERLARLVRRGGPPGAFWRGTRATSPRRTALRERPSDLFEPVSGATSAARQESLF